MTLFLIIYSVVVLLLMPFITSGEGWYFKMLYILSALGVPVIGFIFYAAALSSGNRVQNTKFAVAAMLLLISIFILIFI
jgi:hypothetical protein